MNSISKKYQQLVLRRIAVHSKRGTEPSVALEELRLMLVRQTSADQNEQQKPVAELEPEWSKATGDLIV